MKEREKIIIGNSYTLDVGALSFFPTIKIISIHKDYVICEYESLNRIEKIGIDLLNMNGLTI